ncbi:MAG TPA: hypothetical protein VE176_12035, partial [Candidatus Limnocylindrales bacterium]|nr:hypothetical protein [Candidatus Limnocylindrales bacterium]
MKPLKQLRPEVKAAREDVIVFAVGGYKLAIAAGAVKEIRGTDDLHTFKLGGISAQIAKLKYTLERNGTTYFVIDAAQHFRLPASNASRVMVLRNMPTGVLVDSTDRIMEILALHALPPAFT